MYFFGSPALVPLFLYRLGRNVRRRRILQRVVPALPLILLYQVVWAVGEAVGYARGGGRSLLRVR